MASNEELPEERDPQPETEGKKKKKKNKKKKGAAEDAGKEEATEEATTETAVAKTEEALRALTLPTTSTAPVKGNHAFWDTQPVPALQESIGHETNQPIVPVYEDIRQEPYNLPAGFEWCEVDIEDPTEMQEVYKLLHDNYVEDDDNMFRFDYSIPFLKWALQPPGWIKLWHTGVRGTKNGKLLGFITAIPADVVLYEKECPMVEINFLCVHKKLRKHRLAPVLIKEITRRVHTQGRFQAVYTAGVVLPRPVAKCRYYHRSINPKKLIDIKFSHLSQRMTMKRTIKLYSLPEKPLTPGIRAMVPADVPVVHRLLVEYLKKQSLYQVFSEDECAHWLLPREGIINSFVVEDPKSGVVTDFCSFYTLPSTIMGHPKYDVLLAAYSYYNVATKTPLVDLMKDALILARDLGFDVFNALNLMDNAEFLTELKFGLGDGNLQYYVYNWACAEMPPDQVGLVLL